MAPQASSSGPLDLIRKLEKALHLPTNGLFLLILGAALLIIFAVQSKSLGPCSAQERSVSALKSAVEELDLAQDLDRKDLAALQAKLDEIKKEKAELQLWRAEHEKVAGSSHEHFVRLAQGMLRLTMGLEKETANVSQAHSARRPSTDDLSQLLKVSKGDVEKASSQVQDLAWGKMDDHAQIAVTLQTRMLGLRVVFERLKVMLAARVAAERAVVSKEKESEECEPAGALSTGNATEECQAVGKLIEELKKGSGQTQDAKDKALVECAESVVAVAMEAQEQRQAAAKKVGQLSKVLSQALDDPKSQTLQGSVKEELKSVEGVCRKSGEGREGRVEVVRVQEAGALSGSCSALGCRCNATAEEIEQYLNYTSGQVCPDDWLLVQHLIVERSCHSLPRRRCFAPNWPNYTEPLPLPKSLWDSKALMDSNVRWEHHHCQNFSCLRTEAGAPLDCPGCFDWSTEKSKFESKEKGQMSMEDALKKNNSTLRIGLDLGGGTGSFAAIMAQHQVTVITTGVDLDGRTQIGGGGEESDARNASLSSSFPSLSVGLRKGAPFMETAALRGLLTLHVPHTARLPFFDATLDIIHASASVDGMNYDDFEEAFYDWDRILRPGGLIWFSLFHSQVRVMTRYMEIVDMFKYTFIHRTVTPSVRPDGLHVYVNFLVEKPREREIASPTPPAF